MVFIAPVIALVVFRENNLCMRRKVRCFVNTAPGCSYHVCLHVCFTAVPVSKVKGITGLCDIELPKSGKETGKEEEKEPVEEWCEVMFTLGW